MLTKPGSPAGARLILGLLLGCTAATGGPVDMYPSLNRMIEEGAALEQAEPVRWRQSEAEIRRLFEENRKIREAWRMRGMPPAPDLKPAGAPLSRLVFDLLRLPLSSDYDAFLRAGHLEYLAYIHAIVGHPDPRRIDVLLEYREKLSNEANWLAEYDPWGRFIGNAAPLDWAVQHLPQLFEQNPRLSYDNLPYTLLHRFAESLPPSLRDAGYRYVRQHVPTGPKNGDFEVYWKLIVRIDPAKACDELIAYFDAANADRLAIVWLLDPLTPNPKIFAAAKRWLPRLGSFDADLFGDYLRAWLVRDDPANYLAPSLRRIDSILARRGDSSWVDGAERIIEAILTVDSEASRTGLARYANQKKLGVLSDVRREIVLQLGESRHRSLERVAREWMRDAWEGDKEWLRSVAVEQWGEYGRALLEKADPKK